ncbi:general substrate transporter [Mycena sp. CBHHK59/15]|nr:general substrate transporter [Mycena sp. CBHHK59/15]
MPAYLLFGYNNGVAGGLLDLPGMGRPGRQKAHNSHIQGTVVAVYTLGALWSISCTLIGDKLAFSFPQLIVGRLITGLGFGAISATAPNWQTECSRAGHRGFVVMLEGLFISGGLSISAWLNFGFSHTTGGVSWRFSLAFSCFFAVIVFYRYPSGQNPSAFLPPRARWLVKKGRIEEARHVLAALDDVPLDSPEIAQEIREIEVSLHETGKGSFRDIFRNGPSRFANRAFIAATTQCFQQMSGINVLGFYQATIFRTFLGLDSSTARILSATVFTCRAHYTMPAGKPSAPIGAYTIERVGRRKLMIFGAAGMGMCMALIAGCTSHPTNDTAVHAAIAFVYLFSLFFVTGYLGLAFLYSSEIAPLSVRTPITALSTTSTWLFNFTVVEATPTGFNSLGFKYFIIYAVINWFLILPTVYYLFPETQGLHLESVDRIFLESKSIFEPVRAAKRLRAHAIIGKDGDIQIAGEREKSVDEKTEEA